MDGLPGYSDALGAQRRIMELGGDLDAAATLLAERVGLREIPPTFAQRGNICLADVPAPPRGEVHPALGVVGMDGVSALFVGAKGGYVRVPLRACRRAWSSE